MQRLPLIFLACFFIFVPLAHADDAGRTRYDFGVFAFEDGDYEDAEKNLLAAHNQRPNNPVYNHALGKVYLKTEQLAKAKKYFDLAWESDPETMGLQYDLAQWYFKTDDFSSAARLFEDLAQKEPENAMAAYFAGVCQYELKNYEQAAPWFETAARTNPGLGDYTVKWLAALKPQKKARPYRLFFRMAAAYVSNVMLEPRQIDLYSDQDAWGPGFQFWGQYDVISQKNLTAGAGYSHYETAYPGISQYDLICSVGEVYLKHRVNSLGLEMSYFPHYYWIGHDKFLARHQLRPKISWAARNDLLLALSYSYYDNEYFDEGDDDKDGYSHEIQGEALYNIGQSGAYVLASGNYEFINADAEEQSYNEYGARTVIYTPLFWGVCTSISGNISQKRYDEPDQYYGVLRKDTFISGYLSLEKSMFFEFLSFGADVETSKNDSNLEDYEYLRTAVSFFLTINL